MKELIDILDKDLQFIDYKVIGEELYIRVNSKRRKAECPYCGHESFQVHSRKERTLKDIPIQGKKVIIKLEQKKYFCKNEECERKTFAERFSFYDIKATKTKRLQEEIMLVAMTQSSIAASRYLRKSVADVGKSTICNMLKKGLRSECG